MDYNLITVTEFILLGFPALFPVQTALFCLFSIFYMSTLLGNVLIIVTTTFSSELLTPMYFFLCNLSLLEIFYTSVTIPKMLLNFLLKTSSISFMACAAQVYFFIALGSIECTLLAVMAYDRYLAVCHPLHYVFMMDKSKCAMLAGSSWISGFVNSMIHTTCAFHLTFCSNRINQFFCDIPPLLKVACGQTMDAEIVLFIVGGAYGFGSFLLTLISYINIISTILKIRSKEGQQKAFSTCTSHLVVVTLFFGTSFSAYLNPTSKNSSEEEKLVPVFYAVITPTLNPIIYTLRNKDFKRALKKMKVHAFAKF
ncbi:PREDICTED: olfactory receptor 5V1-like [Nanorana parkeri]|uniref:olfactory receptor 5V1-like n=1 Tax=Nanorana parkeri TaxID=125878 RepID=UPI000854F85A|nr:PREDICTED: olfactory receptor 5V1-like [Nanorana parkeri]